jgi:hypothetical protein
MVFQAGRRSKNAPGNPTVLSPFSGKGREVSGTAIAAKNAFCRGWTVLGDPMMDSFEISDRAIVEYKIRAGLGA